MSSTENSNSKKSQFDTNETVEGSELRWRVDDMLQDDSITFSELMKTECFTTPLKVKAIEEIVAPKFACPSKSDIKQSLEEESLGKRSAFEKKFLEGTLDKFLEKTFVRRSKRLQNKSSPRGYNEIKLGSDTEEGIIEPSLPSKNDDTNASTNFEHSRQKTEEEDTPNHKSLFQLLNINKREGEVRPNSNFFKTTFKFDGNSSFKTPGAENPVLSNTPRIISLCQSISNKSYSIINQLQKIKRNAVEAISFGSQSQGYLESKDDEETRTDMDCLSMQNFPSTTRKPSTSIYSVDELPKELLELLRMFTWLDFIVDETKKLGKLSLLKLHVAYIEKNYGR